MNDIALAVTVFVAVGAALGFMMVSALGRARREGRAGTKLLGRLWPFLLADLALTILLVVWLLTNP